MPKVGVFWFYRGDVWGQGIDLAGGEEGVPGLIDCPDSHAELWDEKILSIFPELRGCEYYEIPRGRVLWDRNQGCANVYLDATLLDIGSKVRIAQFFDLPLESVTWRTDSHYNTNEQSLQALFKDQA